MNSTPPPPTLWCGPHWSVPNTPSLWSYRNSSKSQQELLLELTWAIWPELPAYGRKAAQFVDLLGYFSLKTPQTEKKVRAFWFHLYFHSFAHPLIAVE